MSSGIASESSDHQERQPDDIARNDCYTANVTATIEKNEEVEARNKINRECSNKPQKRIGLNEIRERTSKKLPRVRK
jgi:hypothetical protein